MELISTKKVIPIVFAVAVWGRHWGGRVVECHCDNMAVVSVINIGSSRDKVMMQLMRSLFFLCGGTLQCADKIYTYQGGHQHSSRCIVLQ